MWIYIYTMYISVLLYALPIMNTGVPAIRYVIDCRFIEKCRKTPNQITPISTGKAFILKSA